MWTLGCAMFEMICGHEPFSGDTAYEMVLSIVELLGQPDADFLAGCQRTRLFFKSLGYRKWRIKTPSEYSKVCKTRARKKHKFKSLDDMKAKHLEENNPTEAVEREQCIELLKAMLTVHPSRRITPRQVLTHPFITKDYPNVQTHVLKTSRSEDCECEPSAAPLKDEDSSTIQPDGCTPPPGILPSGVILVQPVTTENTTLLEDQESAVSEPPTTPLEDEDSSTIQPDGCTPPPEILPSGVILVQPVTTENTTLLEDQESAVSEPPTTPLEDEDSSTIQPDGCTPPPEILPSGVILVQPVTTENTTLLEDQESAVSEPPTTPLKDEDSRTIQPDGCTQSPEILPSGVILVQPVTTEKTTSLEDQESAVSEPPIAPLKDEDSSTIQPDGCTPSPEILPSGLILARPVTAENTTLLEDQEIPSSFQSVLNKTSESSVSDADDKTKLSEASTTCEDTGTKKKGKKKNGFRRVLSWLRKRFSCRVSPREVLSNILCRVSLASLSGLLGSFPIKIVMVCMFFPSGFLRVLRFFQQT
ncbi:homeodomain-interacting protein kinase 1-like [Sparus aurata]|uniref:homeodomain-interacting protein kinase 1-like n=1 Tax=Sparus aurata TaxID=8175 RepID=UPI0011C18404|nr:homeodomain-interacting protein kinase 1-like [Sparus aurata]